MKLNVAIYEQGHSVGWGKLSFQTARIPHKKSENFFLQMLYLSRQGWSKLKL